MFTSAPAAQRTYTPLGYEISTSQTGNISGLVSSSGINDFAGNLLTSDGSCSRLCFLTQ